MAGWFRKVTHNETIQSFNHPIKTLSWYWAAIF